MVKEGMEVYYIEDGQVHSGNVTDVEKRGRETVFSIDTVGACEGLCVFSETVIGSSVFLTREEAGRFLRRGMNGKEETE